MENIIKNNKLQFLLTISVLRTLFIALKFETFAGILPLLFNVQIVQIGYHINSIKSILLASRANLYQLYNRGLTMFVQNPEKRKTMGQISQKIGQSHFPTEVRGPVLFK